jgi:hypothetical protein
MKTTIHLSIAGNRLDVRSASGLAQGLAAAAIKYGWLQGENLPRSAKAVERAAWTARRAARA